MRDACSSSRPFDRCASSSPRPAFAVWPLLGKSGKRGAWPCLWTKLSGATSAPRRRFLSASVPLRLDTLCLLGAVSPRGHWPLGYVLVQHAPPVVAAGEPLDAASPVPRLRLSRGGSAGPPPLSNDSGSVPGRKDEADYVGGGNGVCRIWLTHIFVQARSMAWPAAAKNSSTLELHRVCGRTVIRWRPFSWPKSVAVNLPGAAGPWKSRLRPYQLGLKLRANR